MKLIFHTKVNKICRLDFSSKNILSNVIHFSIQHYKTRISPNKFSQVPLFHYFYIYIYIKKIDSNAHFDSVFLNIGQFNIKTINIIWFFIIKIELSINFTHLCLIHLWSELTSKVCQKVGNINRKTKQNCFKAFTLHFFSQKAAVLTEKQ